MVDAAHGPAAMAPAEAAAVSAILESIYCGEDRSFVDNLLRCRTWGTVYDKVREEKPGLFNALNLAALKAGRPAVLEAPVDC